MTTNLNTPSPEDTAEWRRPADLDPANLYPSNWPVTAELAGRSHRGRVRPNNEDRFLIARAGRFLDTLATNLNDGSVPREFGETVYGLVVADGMGGSAAGEVASRLAITTLMHLVLNTPDWNFGTEEPELEVVLRRTSRRFLVINETLMQQASKAKELAGMGTTLTLACNHGGHLYIAHVGDSPAFLYRKGALQRLTRDHTVAQVLADTGVIGPDEVATHRLRNVLTNVLGREANGKPEIRRLVLEDHDRLLLCSDGLTDMVKDQEIAFVMGSEASADDACRVLIDMALEAGGSDNITAIVANYRVHAR